MRTHLIPALGAKGLTRLSSTIVRMLVRAKEVAKLVVVVSARPPEVVPLTIEEARALLRAAEGSRLYALQWVALAIGLRRGEALGLCWRDLVLERGELRVTQTLQRLEGRLMFVPPKSERSRRRVPLPTVALRAFAGTLRPGRA